MSAPRAPHRWLPGRLVPLLGLCVVLGGGGCDATPTGEIVVALQLQTTDGQGLDCAAFGAEELELTLYLGEDDVLPYDRVAWPCAVGEHRLQVEARRYARVEARLVSGGGATVRFCGPEGTTAALLDSPAITVSAGDRAPLDWTLAGTPGSCPAPAPTPSW